MAGLRAAPVARRGKRASTHGLSRVPIYCGFLRTARADGRRARMLAAGRRC